MANREPMDQDLPEAQVPRLEVSAEQLQHLFAGVSAEELNQFTLSSGANITNPSLNPNPRLRRCYYIRENKFFGLRGRAHLNLLDSIWLD
ncbi:hypothetical protein OnM2_049038 [Erysiphe neolycopersici]|uniref:Uncharacterized protein n=1 Tax=Erysiphe neolycopersici TaxID=212602 RepID=A0A420HT39_9PEZI|nr:hypothetical protein OnM2_049038 [Erysiphe neolycopersici]